MFWKRYGFAVTWALPAGIAIGAGLGLIMRIIGEVDLTSSDGWASIAGLMVMGAAAGGAFALAAMIGAAVFVVIRERGRKPEPKLWVAGGTMGAIAGVAVLWLTIAAIYQLTSDGRFLSLFLYAIFAAFTAAFAGYAANVLLRKSEVRWLKQVHGEAEPTGTTDDTNQGFPGS